MMMHDVIPEDHVPTNGLGLARNGMGNGNGHANWTWAWAWTAADERGRAAARGVEEGGEEG